MENDKSDALKETYSQAIEIYKSCRRALSECQIAIEVAQLEQNMEALRVALSEENRLRTAVDEARAKVKWAAYELVRHKGMLAREKHEKPKIGLLQKIIKIVKP